MQVIIMTSNISLDKLNGFFYQWNKYFFPSYPYQLVVCGFDEKPPSGSEFYKSQHEFFEIGPFIDYPANKWSDALLVVLEKVAEEVFLLLLDDFWLVRQTDTAALKMMRDYLLQFHNVVRFDVTTDRLFAGGGTQYIWNERTYNTLGYLDLIKSDPASEYHLSLWGALWRRDLLKEFIIPGEEAQEIEMQGTPRLRAREDLLVLGTRQGPLKHTNVFQANSWNKSKTAGLPAICSSDLDILFRLGYLESIEQLDKWKLT